MELTTEVFADHDGKPMLRVLTLLVSRQVLAFVPLLGPLNSYYRQARLESKVAFDEDEFKLCTFYEL